MGLKDRINVMLGRGKQVDAGGSTCYVSNWENGDREFYADSSREYYHAHGSVVNEAGERTNMNMLLCRYDADEGQNMGSYLRVKCSNGADYIVYDDYYADSSSLFAKLRELSAKEKGSAAGAVNKLAQAGYELSMIREGKSAILALEKARNRQKQQDQVAQMKKGGNSGVEL